MTQRNSLSLDPIFTGSLTKRALIGASIAFVLIALFVLPVHGKEEWGNFWKIRPIIVTTLAGAVGGSGYFIIDRFFHNRQWSKIIAIILSLIFFTFCLWIGSVIGCAGTLWN